MRLIELKPQMKINEPRENTEINEKIYKKLVKIINEYNKKLNQVCQSLTSKLIKEEYNIDEALNVLSDRVFDEVFIQIELTDKYTIGDFIFQFPDVVYENDRKNEVDPTNLFFYIFIESRNIEELTNKLEEAGKLLMENNPSSMEIGNKVIEMDLALKSLNNIVQLLRQYR